MIRLFEIGLLDEQTCMVWSVSYVSPTEYLDEVAEALEVHGYSGRVVFDLLLANGQASNRFISVYFDGRDFDRATFVVIVSDLDTLRLASLDFYHGHPEFLEDSVLSAASRLRIRENICL